MKSIYYTFPWLYEYVMLKIYCKISNRYHFISKLIGKDKSVLDLGCGSGILSDFLYPTCKYIGWDLNKKFVDYGTKRGRNLKCKNIFNFNDYPKVDIIVLNGVLHHVYNKSSLLIHETRKKSRKMVIVVEDSFHGVEREVFLYNVFLKIRKSIKIIDVIFGDHDGINKIELKKLYETFSNKKQIKSFFRKQGKCKIFEDKICIYAVY